MTQPITRTSVVAWCANPVAADVAGETVLMSLERGKCYGLGSTGTDIWKRLSQPVRVEELSHQLAAEYDADASVIERDLLSLLEELAAEGLIEVRPVAN